MKIGKGVEWAMHACTMMALLPPDKVLKADAIARYYDLPPKYMAKHLQALKRSGVAVSVPGPRGGYRLAKPPSDISLWSIAEAIEGAIPLFQCEEIRQNGPCAHPRENCETACPIAQVFLEAEERYRESLGAVSVAQINARVAANMPGQHATSIMEWINAEATTMQE